MKRKEILKKLKLEVENCMPKSVLEQTKNVQVEKDLTPIYDQINGDGTKVKTNFKLISATMALTFFWFLMLVSLLPILTNWLNPEPIITSKLTIEINPSIELLLDQNDCVVLTLANNKHAELLLAEENLKGLTLVEATNKIVTLATKAGYITTQNTDNVENAVLISVASEDKKKEQDLLSKSQSEIKKFYLSNQIYGVVLTDFESKQKLVEMVASLNPKLSQTEKQELQKCSVKSLNQQLHDSYINLKRRFKHDFVLENLNEKIQPLQTSYLKEIENINNSLTQFETRLNNFDAVWQQELELSRQKILDWQQELETLRASLSVETDQEKLQKINQDIENLTKFIASEQQNLNERETGKAIFDFYKQQLQTKIENYRNQLKIKYENYCLNLENQLGIVKDGVHSCYEQAKQCKVTVIKNNEKSYNNHLSNKTDYNTFYTSYNNWVVDHVPQTNSLKQNWEQSKQVWEQKFSSYVNF